MEDHDVSTESAIVVYTKRDSIASCSKESSNDVYEKENKVELGKTRF
jgi:hypothetical protein